MVARSIGKPLTLISFLALAAGCQGDPEMFPIVPGDADFDTAGDDGGDGDSDVSVTCARLAPEEMYLRGSYSPTSDDLRTVAPLDDPRDSCPGLSTEVGPGVVRPTDGRLVVVEPGLGGHIYIVTPDEAIWSGADEEWRFPSTPHVNDQEYDVTDGCALDGGLRLSPELGTIAYRCGDFWVREDGSTIPGSEGRELLAFFDDGSALLADASTGLAIIDANDTEVAVEAPTGDSFEVIAARHFDSGVWVAVLLGSELHRWRYADGTLTDDGALADLPAEATSAGVERGAFDRDGQWYEPALVETEDGDLDGVVRRPPPPFESEVVYIEETGYAVNFWDEDPDPPFVWAHPDSRILTGP